MSNWLKLLIPVLLGLAAAGVNFWAMEIGSSMTYVQLAGPVKEGDVLQASHLKSVRIKFGGESLKLAAVPYKNRLMMLGRPVTRQLEKGDLLLQQDIGRTVPEPKLDANEVAVDLSLSNFNYDPSLLKVGNRVGFYVLKLNPNKVGPNSTALTPVSTALPAAGATDSPGNKGELLGPFRVVSVGARTDEEHGLLEKDGTTKTPANITVAVLLDDTTHKMTSLGDALILAKSARNGDPGSIRSMVLYGSGK